MDRLDMRSEKGAATVIEATVIFPLVFLVVIFLIFMGFTYAQKSLLTYHTSQLAAYLSKTISYTGYQYLEEPFYQEQTPLTISDYDKAMKDQAPYRYLFGLFKDEYTSLEDSNGSNLIQTSAEKMAGEYLSHHGIIKTSGGSVALPADVNFGTVINNDGYVCAISANTSRVVVYIGQNFVFANFFRMIGIGGRKMTISSRSTAFISDSMEIVRMADMAFDMIRFTEEKIGSDKIGKIKEMIAKVTGSK